MIVITVCLAFTITMVIVKLLHYNGLYKTKINVNFLKSPTVPSVYLSHYKYTKYFGIFKEPQHIDKMY